MRTRAAPQHGAGRLRAKHVDHVHCLLRFQVLAALGDPGLETRLILVACYGRVCSSSSSSSSSSSRMVLVFTYYIL